MEFTSLKKMYEKYIQSFPALTHLDLTANEIKIIELVLSFKREGYPFFMNHKQVADHLVLGNTKFKIKTTGNIIRGLKTKGYITKSQSHNFNGNNGGSSSTIVVDEDFLEKKLKEAFASNLVHENVPTPEHLTKQIQKQTSDEFFAELEAMEEMPRENTGAVSLQDLIEFEPTENYQNDDAYMQLETLEDFKLFLEVMMSSEQVNSNKVRIQFLIDNKAQWDLNALKEGFAKLILQHQT